MSKTGGPRVANVNADTKAKACRAVAEWEAKKARSRVSHAARAAVEAADLAGEYVTLEEAAAIIAAVEGAEVELPTETDDSLVGLLDVEVKEYRKQVAVGDTRAALRQRARIMELRRKVEEAHRVEKQRVHKDGRPVESNRSPQ